MSQQSKREKKSVTPVQMILVVCGLVAFLAALSYVYLIPHSKPPGTMDEWNRAAQKMEVAQTSGVLDRIRQLPPARRKEVSRMYPDLVKQVEQEEAGKSGKP